MGAVRLRIFTEPQLGATPAEVVARLEEWGQAGAGTVYLQVLDPSNRDHIRLIGAEVLPAVASSRRRPQPAQTAPR